MRTAAGPGTIDSVLLVAFGGPTPGCCRERDPCPGEAVCFVDGVLGNNPARAARVAEVAAHYRELGGFSPFNAATSAQAEALSEALRRRGLDLPVRTGYRHWRPYVRETVAELSLDGFSRILAVILAPHQSTISWDWYIKVVSEALDPLTAGEAAPRVAFLDPWWAHPGYVEACADRVREALARLAEREAARAEKAELVFTAHAIPCAIARTAPYERQFSETAEAVAARLGRPCALAYQSGPSRPEIPWTEPDIADYLAERAGPGRDFVVAPVGFLCDNVEILYDLDVAARAAAESRGSGFFRAATVGTHPAFIGMLADAIAQRYQREI